MDDRGFLILIVYIGVVASILFGINSLMHNRTVNEVREVREIVKENRRLIKEIQTKFSNLSSDIQKLKEK